MRKIMILVWVALLALVLVYFYSNIGRMPDRMAVHFDAFGNPNGFQTRDLFQSTFLTFIFITNVISAALFLSIGFLPTKGLNIPYKSYWLSKPELKEGLNQRLQAIPTILGLFLNLVILITEQIIFQSNLPDYPLKISGTLALVIMVLWMGILLFTVFRLFTPPRDA